MMAPAKIAGEGASVLKVPTVSGVHESVQTMLIILPEKAQKRIDRTRILGRVDGALKLIPLKKI